MYKVTKVNRETQEKTPLDGVFERISQAQTWADWHNDTDIPPCTHTYNISYAGPEAECVPSKAPVPEDAVLTGESFIDHATRTRRRHKTYDEFFFGGKDSTKVQDRSTFRDPILDEPEMQSKSVRRGAEIAMDMIRASEDARALKDTPVKPCSHEADQPQFEGNWPGDLPKTGQTYVEMLRSASDDLSTSFWLAQAIHALQGRDPVDSLNDVEYLLVIQQARTDEALQKAQANYHTDNIVNSVVDEVFDERPLSSVDRYIGKS